MNDSSVTVDIASSSCTAGDVKARLAEQYPKLGGILGPAILAVNQQAVRPTAQQRSEIDRQLAELELP